MGKYVQQDTMAMAIKVTDYTITRYFAVGMLVNKWA